MSYLLEIPAREAQPTAPLVLEQPKPAALPVPVVRPPVPVVQEAKKPRLPLSIRMDNALRPLWRIGPGVFFLGTAVPMLAGAIGGAIAAMHGGNSMVWVEIGSRCAPIGTIGIPALMIAVRFFADIQRMRQKHDAVKRGELS